MNKIKRYFFLLMFSTQSAFAGNLAISPVHVLATANDSAGAITLKNPSLTKTESYQAIIFTWTQKNGKDILTPSRDIVVSPVILKMPPNSTRVLRFMKLVQNVGVGQYYKLELRQLPDDTVVKGVKIYFDQFLPLGFEPSNTSPKLSASVVGGKLFVTNQGTKSVQVQGLGLQGSKPWKTGALGWLLPGGGLTYPVSVKSGQALALTTSQSTLTVTVQ